MCVDFKALFKTYKYINFFSQSKNYLANHAALDTGLNRLLLN